MGSLNGYAGALQKEFRLPPECWELSAKNEKSLPRGLVENQKKTKERLTEGIEPPVFGRETGA